MKGFINIIKPQGVSSAFVVGAVKRAFHTPCGHMGTLDPMASGVLPVGVGKTSRLFPYLLDKRKKYIAEFSFGYLTDTLDKTGEITETTDILPSEEEIKKALRLFIGEIDQIPPKYSAKSVGGVRGYALARRGVEFDLQSKKVQVFAFDFLGKTAENTYKFSIECGGGTYIRSLCRDLGEKTGSLATMVSLDRVQAGCFSYENGVRFEDFKASETPEKYLIPPETTVNFPCITLEKERATKILNGVFADDGTPDGLYRVFFGGEFWGIGESVDGTLKIKSYVR